MQWKQFSIAALVLAAITACSGPIATDTPAQPLPPASQTVSTTPTLSVPPATPTKILPKPTPSTTQTVCPKTSLNTRAQSKAFSQLASFPVSRAKVTWEKCFDRFTVTLPGTKQPGYHAEYVDVPRTDGGGDAISMNGNAFLLLVIRAPDGPSAVIDPSVGEMIVDVRPAGVFEAHTSFAIGLDQKRPFGVRVLPGVARNTVRVMVTFAR